MMPSLKLVRSGLNRTTEAIAAELALARPGSRLPAWTRMGFCSSEEFSES